MNVDKMALDRARIISGFVSGSILDIGANTKLLKSIVSNRYTSIDINGIHDIVSSAEALPILDSKYDTVVMSEVIEHVRDPSKAIAECFRVAKNKIIITTPNPCRFDYILEWIIRKKDISSSTHLCRFGKNEIMNMVKDLGSLKYYNNYFLEIPTFSRLGSLSYNISSRVGSCSLYIFQKTTNLKI